MKEGFLCLLMVFFSTNNLGLKRAQFNLSFSNIRGLHCNINKVHQLLLSEKPDVLFLSETQIIDPPDRTHLNCPGYTLAAVFQKKGGICCFIKNSLAACHINKI